MDIFYINHIGERIDLDTEEIILQYQELFDYSWDVEARNGRISKFYRQNATIPITVGVTADTEERYIEILHRFFSITEKDILSSKSGKLYLGDQYLSCFISGSLKEDAFMGIPFQKKNLTLVTDHPFWCKETTIQFLPGNMDSDSRQQNPVVTGETFSGKNLDNKAVIGEFSFDFLRKSNRKVRYPQFDLPFDFSKTYGKRVINNTGAFSESDFILTIYGFVDTPRILIAGHPYVVNAIVYEGERVVIDSAAGTVKKIGRLGEETNLYNARGKEYSVFQKIPPGVQTISWSGGFGFDITLFDERSEPKWSL